MGGWKARHPRPRSTFGRGPAAACGQTRVHGRPHRWRHGSRDLGHQSNEHLRHHGHDRPMRTSLLGSTRGGPRCFLPLPGAVPGGAEVLYEAVVGRAGPRAGNEEPRPCTRGAAALAIVHCRQYAAARAHLPVRRHSYSSVDSRPPAGSRLPAMAACLMRPSVPCTLHAPGAAYARAAWPTGSMIGGECAGGTRTVAHGSQRGHRQ